MTTLVLPRSIRIGAGTLGEVPQALAQLGLSKPVVIADPFLASNGMLGRLSACLAATGMTPRIFVGVVPDPTVRSLDAASGFIREAPCDCVIGLGGGSAIDTAKAAAVLGRRGGSIRAMKAPHTEDSPSLPIIAVPTTAGSGSEATRFTVITDELTDEKMLCAGLAYLPTVAVVDFELTLSKPRRLTADTGIDALTHAIEAYVSRRANPLADGFALAAMRTIWTNLRLVCDDPTDRRGREGMALGSLQAGIAFSNASVALVHGMSRPIGAHFHVAHGLSNAMLLPTVTEWSASDEASQSRYATCARTMGVAALGDEDGAATASLVDALRQLNRALDVPSPRSYGLDERRWGALLPTMAAQALASGSPDNNPRVPDAATIEELYRKAWG